MQTTSQDRQAQADANESICHFLNLTINSRDNLSQFYMPFISNGCLFLPSDTLPQLRDRAFLIIKLSYAKEEFAITGTVRWLNPSGGNLPGFRQKGYGIQFEYGAEELLELIENQLALSEEIA